MTLSRTVYSPANTQHLTVTPSVPRHLRGATVPVARVGPMTSASLRVEVRSGGAWQPYHVRGYRWLPSVQQWTWYADDEVRSGVMVVTRRSSGGAMHGYLVGQISPSHVELRVTELSRPSPRHPDTWQIQILSHRNETHGWFGSEMYRATLAASLRPAQTLGVVVAVGTGIALGAGFGPCAAGLGLSGGLTGAANAIAGGLASCLTTFIHQNATAMMAAVNSPGGVGRYWSANTTNFERIVTDSVLSGIFSFGTNYFLPGPTSLTSSRDWSHLAVNRLGTHIAGALNTLLSSVAGGNPQNISEAQVLRQLQQDTFRNAIVQLFN